MTLESCVYSQIPVLVSETEGVDTTRLYKGGEVVLEEVESCVVDLFGAEV